MLYALHSHYECSYAYCKFKWGDKTVLGNPFNEERLKRCNFASMMSLLRAIDFPDGGLDESLLRYQDWDLWLNAVINHNAKGLYKQEVYFETTMPHPGGLSDDSHRNWIDRTTAIKRKYGIKQKKICVTRSCRVN